MLSRGVMIPPIAMDASGFSVLGDLPLLEKLPAAILYWDKLVVPTYARGVLPAYDRAVDALVKLNAAETFVLSKENSFSSNKINEYANNMALSFDDRFRRPGENWAILPALTDRSDSLTDTAFPYLTGKDTEIFALEVKLKGALPVPTREVPYLEILEFKYRRKDELDRLHSAIEGIALKFAAVGNEEDRLARALNDLQRAVSDVETTFDEKWRNKVKKSLTAAFALDFGIPASMLYMLGLPIDKAAIVGVASSVFKSGFEAIRPGANAANPFAYAIDAARM